MKNKFAKVFLWSIGLVTLLIVTTAIILPFIIQVDKYRPEIVKAINEEINGSFSLGNLKLDLWGKVAVSAEKADLKDATGNSVLSVGRFFVKVPFLSLLKLSPEVRIELDSPQINLERPKKGEWNVLGLVKKQKVSPTAPEKEVPKTENPPHSTQPAPEMPQETSKAPLAVLAKTKVSLQVENAALQLKDSQTQAELSLGSVFLRTGELSLQSMPEFELGAQIKTKTPQVVLEGPVLISGKSKGADLQLLINLDDLKIEKEGFFIKKTGVFSNAEMVLSRLSDGVDIKDGSIRFHQASLDFEGQIRPLGSSLFRMGAKGVELKSFESFLQAMPKDSVQGKLSFEFDVQGPVNQLQGKIKSDLENFSFKALSYPKPVKLSGALRGQIFFSDVPKGDFTFSSNSVDAAGIEIKPLKVLINQVGPKVNISMTEAKALDGKLTASFNLDMSGKSPRYRFSKIMKGLSLEKAIASQMDVFKNTLVGSLDGSIEGEGEGFEPEVAKKKLKARGKFEVKPARFSTIDINKVITEVSGKLAQQLQEKVPQVKGKTLKLDPVASEFKKVTASFTISDGTFSSPDFFAESLPQKGIDIRGNTRVGMVDYAVSAEWEVSDPYNVTKAKDLSVDVAGVRVNSILVEKGKAFRFPLKVRGTLFEPKYEYGAVPEALAQVALKNISGAAQDKAKDEAKKKAKQELQKLTDKAPAPVKNLIKGLFR